MAPDVRGSVEDLAWAETEKNQTYTTVQRRTVDPHQRTAYSIAVRLTQEEIVARYDFPCLGSAYS